MNASATGGGVVVGDSASIADAITAEAAHKWTDDGSGRRIDSGRKARGSREATPNNQNHTTINRDAGDGVRGQKQ